MTVRAIVPVAEYTGDGVTVRFDWDWDMIEDSSINVLLGSENVFNWTLEDQSVVFDTAPASGDEIIIYRRTTIWMPENYQAFGRFHSEKTELSVDRAILIAQERFGKKHDGIVGAADLSVTRAPFTMTVVSERGTDAILPMYVPDDSADPSPTPDPSIIWDGDDIVGGRYATVSNSAIMRFHMSFDYGDPAEASAGYPNYNANEYVGWLNVDPDNDQYWIRITETSGLVTSRYLISDGLAPRASGEAFQMRGVAGIPDTSIVDQAGAHIIDDAGDYITTGETIGGWSDGPYISVFTHGDTAPSTRTGTFTVEICKDSGGLPDEGWVSRTVTLESLYNA